MCSGARPRGAGAGRGCGARAERDRAERLEHWESGRNL